MGTFIGSKPCVVIEKNVGIMVDRVCYLIFTQADFTRVLGTGTGILITQYLPDCFSGCRDLPDTYPVTRYLPEYLSVFGYCNRVKMSP